jgi:hypothetical protein
MEQILFKEAEEEMRRKSAKNEISNFQQRVNLEKNSSFLIEHILT